MKEPSYNPIKLLRTYRGTYGSVRHGFNLDFYWLSNQNLLFETVFTDQSRIQKKVKSWHLVLMIQKSEFIQFQI